ncbi:uncharacterized protein J4E92_006885 [Alternaria infectoria]|uniref:uncharacterized protein n=1 Tax=Alternaria infectoria TaxID=45303 RepID=UPI0022210F46|nr:uncharacterized protein J4E92_006885 [Alternaria infectoria]KAI4924849.1 hypothetical protein J4E92_006885 [Alternaria infectoria]
MTDSAWAEALSKKRTALERAKINVTNSVTDLNTFEASLNGIADTYIDKTTSSMLTWLLIMDNLDEFDTVATIWPTSVKSHGAIIVTTQTPCDTVRWADYNIPLKPMDSHEGSEMLLAQTETSKSDTDIKRQEELAKEISSAVGGLPLWISHLSGFIAQSRCSLEECLDIYRSSSGLLDEQHHRDRWMYDKYPGAVFDLAFSKLHEDAKSLLNVLAFFNPDGVPEKMLLVDVPDENFEFLRPVNRQRFLNAIASLRNSHLIKREGGKDDTYLTTHRSLQRVVLHKLDQDPAHRKVFFERACYLLGRVFPRPSPLQQPESEKWPQIEAYLPQLLTLESAFLRAQPPIKGSLDFAVLLSSVGLNVWDRGLSNDAKSLMLTAEKVLDSIGWDRWAMERSDIYVILGILTDTVGITQRTEGLQYREKALEIRQHYVDTIPQADMTLEEEIRYYNAITDRICSWQQFNRYEDIEKHCTIVIEKYKSWGKETDFPYEYAKFYHHMAYVLIYRGERAKAVDYAQHASKLLRMGNFGLLGVLFRFDCATVMFQAGQIEAAISEHEQVLEHRLLKLGRSNLMTLQSRLMLGVIHYTLHDFSKAK